MLSRRAASEGGQLSCLTTSHALTRQLAFKTQHECPSTMLSLSHEFQMSPTSLQPPLSAAQVGLKCRLGQFWGRRVLGIISTATQDDIRNHERRQVETEKAVISVNAGGDRRSHGEEGGDPGRQPRPVFLSRGHSPPTPELPSPPLRALGLRDQAACSLHSMWEKSGAGPGWALTSWQCSSFCSYVKFPSPRWASTGQMSNSDRQLHAVWNIGSRRLNEDRVHYETKGLEMIFQAR